MMLTPREHRLRLILAEREQVLARERVEREERKVAARRLRASQQSAPVPKTTSKPKRTPQEVAAAFVTWADKRQASKKTARAEREARFTSYTLQPHERRNWRSQR